MSTSNQPPSPIGQRSLFGQRAGLLGLGAAIAALGLLAYGPLQSRMNGTPDSSPSPAPAPIVAKTVVAMGRLEPHGEVLNLGASGKDLRLAQLLVKQGDWVQKGQVIAILDTRDRLQAELEQAREQVRVNQAQLAQVEAGAKTGEIVAQQSTVQRIQVQWEGDRNSQRATLQRLQAQVSGEIASQQATIRKLEAELANAQAEYRRYQKLSTDGAISASTYDSKRLALETSSQQLTEAKANLERIASTGKQSIAEAQATLTRIEGTGRQQIGEARATLAKIAEVRPVDVQTAQAQVNAAIATVKKAQADLDLASVRSPSAGQILKIHTRAGEVVASEGIADLGQTNRMVAVAEVYETDVQRIKQGQKAIITSPAFPGEAIGRVDEIGLQIYKNDVLDTDPTAAADARIVEVKILLDPASSRKVQGFTNLEVAVAIHRANL